MYFHGYGWMAKAWRKTADNIIHGQQGMIVVPSIDHVTPITGIIDILFQVNFLQTID
jgi:hypothetical protein